MINYLTGIKNSGNPHIGSIYLLNELSNIVYSNNQNKSDVNNLMFLIANYHSITNLDNIQNIHNQFDNYTHNLIKLALYYKIPKKNIIIQSSIPRLLELYYVMCSVVKFSDIKYMHLIKTNFNESLTLNQICYPILMAADVLVVNPDYIFVGQDQNQHLELYRKICKKYDIKYGLTKNVSKLIKIDDKKLSKSDIAPSPFDTKDVIQQKILSIPTKSTTSSVNTIQDLDNNITNLLLHFESIDIIRLRYEDGTNFLSEKNILINYFYNLKLELENIVLSDKDIKSIYNNSHSSIIDNRINFLLNKFYNK